jgi:hypothetical protein
MKQTVNRDFARRCRPERRAISDWMKERRAGECE